MYSLLTIYVIQRDAPFSFVEEYLTPSGEWGTIAQARVWVGDDIPPHQIAEGFSKAETPVYGSPRVVPVLNLVGRI